jgi:predicted enzyme related to lactoylglutathione lyase
MINFRVRDLDAMLAQLRAAGATVDERVDSSEYGRFGWFVDPAGHRVELWEPPGARRAPGDEQHTASTAVRQNHG